jgi:glutaredoxin 3
MQRRRSLPQLALPVIAITMLFATGVPAQAGCKRVVLYNASWCPYCRKVRAILARNNIRYTIRDATTPGVQAEMIKRFGDASVPRTLVGGSLVNGVNEARIRHLCR